MKQSHIQPQNNDMNLRLTIVCEQFLIMKNEAKMKETAVNIIPCMYHKKDMSLQSLFASRNSRTFFLLTFIVP